MRDYLQKPAIAYRNRYPSQGNKSDFLHLCKEEDKVKFLKFERLRYTEHRFKINTNKIGGRREENILIIGPPHTECIKISFGQKN